VSRAARPLASRRVDWAFLGFWLINFGFITYMVDLEQIVIPDPEHFSYPIWPPRFAIDAIHWWARTFDPVVWHRAPWYRATIWIDSVLFGPFYLFAIYAFVKGQSWIRLPAMVWAGMMIANVTIILFEELAGPTPTPAPVIVVGANLPWLLFPFAVVWRLRREHPFAADDPKLS
jgi:hypothetical protein